MPGFDKTGPDGQGTGTGRRMGPCFSPDQQSNTGAGRGMGRGMGRRAMNSGRGAGRGMRMRQNVSSLQPQPAATEAVSDFPIESHVYELEDRMSAIENKLDRLIETLAAKPAQTEPTEK